MNFQKRRLYFVFFQKPKCRDGKEILEKQDQKSTRCDISKPDISCIALCFRIKIFEYLMKCFSLNIMYVQGDQ